MFERNDTTNGPVRGSETTPHLVRVPEAARITGLPSSVLRKSFMREDKRPRNIPPPPPHRRIGRAVFIFADQLRQWLDTIGDPGLSAKPDVKRRRGRPTVAERIAQRQRDPAPS